MTAVVEELPTVDLRQRLLGDRRNIELRTKYLATRTPEWAAADLRWANDRVLAARLLRGIVGFALVGATGGALGNAMLGPAAEASHAVALPVIVAVGSALSGAVGFAMLGAVGQVVLWEIVGEEWESRHGRGAGAVLSRFGEALTEALCGAMWGALCGLLIGALTWAADAALGLPRFGALDRVAGGGIGGVLTGAVFGALVWLANRRRGPSAAAFHWAQLGPLPMPTYLFTVSAAHRRFVRR